MKRILLFVAIFLMVGVVGKAQRLDITLSDNTIVSYDVNKIQSMEFMPESEPGQITGYWYLGWRVMSTSNTHYNGDEKWIFNGTVMKQVKTNGEETFDLVYAEDMKSFKATSRTSGTTSNYTIVAN